MRAETGAGTRPETNVETDAATFPNLIREVTQFVRCTAIAQGRSAQFISNHDLLASFVDGNDLLAIANRSPLGGLSPDYAPSDLVEIHSFKPKTTTDCETNSVCLREEAARALAELSVALRTAIGAKARVESAFRSYASQCNVFLNWARKSSFCSAAEQSALPGHSQHQLGTTVDLFTEEWAAGGTSVFRNGFGCSPAGLWLAEHAHEFGFVLPYPLHPMDRQPKSACAPRSDLTVPINPLTGYKNEPWHFRFIGKTEAAAFVHNIETKDDRTLEQWLRTKNQRFGEADLPLCDGCACGACATLAENYEPSKSPCKDRALLLARNGMAVHPDVAPVLASAQAKRIDDKHLLVTVEVNAPPHTVTQPPIFWNSLQGFGEGEDWSKLVSYPSSPAVAYPDLPGAWRIAVRESTTANTNTKLDSWLYRFSIAESEWGATYNRANLLLPSAVGKTMRRVRVPITRSAESIDVALWRDGIPSEIRAVSIP